MEFLEYKSVNMIMCIKALVCIWPGVMVSDRRDWISLKLIWHMTSHKTQVELRKRVTCQFGKEYLSLIHDVLVLVLFMFFLMADLPELALNLLTAISSCYSC